MAKKEKEKKIKEIKQSFLTTLFDKTHLVLLIYFVIALLMLWESLFSGRMTAGSDFLGRDYMDRAFLARHGFNLWQPFTFGGVPLVDALHGDVLYPVTIILRIIFAPHIVPILLYLIHLPVAGLFTYLFVRDQRVRTPISFLSGLFYMLAGCIVSLINAGHTGRLIVNCLLPGVIFFINRGYDRNKIVYFILTGFLFGFAVLSPHVQMAYYLALASLFFVIFKTINIWQRDGFKLIFKPGLSYILSAIIGLALAACLILPVFYYLKFSPRGGAGRGYAFATSWSMPPEEIFNLLTPHFSGILDNYWGRNFFKLHTEYLGILPLLFFPFAFIKDWKNPLTRFFTFLGVFSLIIAWGGHTPFYWLFYTALPGFSKFRAPSQIFYLFAFSIAVLAGLGGEKILNLEVEKRKNIIFYMGGLFFIFWIIAIIFAPGFIDLLTPLAGEKERILSNNFQNFQNGLLILSVISLIYAILVFMLNRKKISLVGFTIIAGFIFFLDMWRIEKNFIKTVPHPAKYFAPDEAVHVLREDKSLFRVYPLEYRSDNYLMLFDIQSIGGEHGNQLRRYQEFIGAEKTVMFSPTNLFYPNILNLLNVKYVIMPNFDLSQIPDFHPDPTIDATIKTIRLIINPAYFKLFYQGQRLRIFENLHFLPRVFLVPQYQIINDDKRIMATIKSDTYNPRKTVILEINPGVPQFEDTIIQGQVQITSYKPDRIEIEANLHNPGFLVLTDNFYPLWQAKVDGKKTTVYRADYTSRAIYLPVGKHEIIFYFDSPYFRIGTLISIMTFIVSLIIITINIRKKSY